MIHLVNEDLINKVKEKDRSAFNELFNLYKSKVYKTAYFILQDKALAEDAVQEVFLQLYFKINSLNHPSAFEVWLYRITVNFCRKLIQNSNKLSTMPLEDYEDTLDICESDNLTLPEDILLNKETCSEIMGFIYALPEQQRIPIILYYYNSLSIRDISEVMNCSEGTVKSRLFHGRKLLKNKLMQTRNYSKEAQYILGKGVNIYESR